MIGYRFTRDELAFLIRQIGEKRFRLFDIDSAKENDADDQKAAKSLCKKGILKKTGTVFFVDRVMWVLADAVSHADIYVLSVSGESAAAIGDGIVVLLQKGKGDMWRLYPYKTIQDMVMSDHSNFPPDSRWLFAAGTESQEMSWAECIERMMQDE